MPSGRPFQREAALTSVKATPGGIARRNFTIHARRRGNEVSKPPEAMALAIRAAARSTGMSAGNLNSVPAVSAVSTKPGLMTWMRTFILAKS